MTKMLISVFLACILFAGVVTAGEAQNLKIELTAANNKGANPLVAIWLETEDGTFVQTLKRYGKKAKYFKFLSQWKKAAVKEDAKKADVVTSASIPWKKTIGFELPIQTKTYDLNTGKHVICIESRAKKIRSKAKPLKIKAQDALKGGIFEHEGHVSQVKITAAK